MIEVSKAHELCKGGRILWHNSKPLISSDVGSTGTIECVLGTITVAEHDITADKVFVITEVGGGTEIPWIFDSSEYVVVDSASIETTGQGTASCAEIN